MPDRIARLRGEPGFLASVFAAGPVTGGMTGGRGWMGLGLLGGRGFLRRAFSAQQYADGFQEIKQLFLLLS
ncbi:hypothetical protein SDC9_72815 [bioreactor metagenome]|uniref:Uncharacterized protein n=1 Tax=bioreactor metagenome TaxID=1076179 RepID=A0A644YJK7_9ZZZZ